MSLLDFDFESFSIHSQISIPDFLWSTAISELTGRDLLEEAFTLTTRAHLAGAALELGTYEHLMRQLSEQKFDSSYSIALYRMLSQWFLPNASV